MIGVNVWWVHLAPQNIPSAIVLTLGNKVVLYSCLLYTSDAADEAVRVYLGGRRIIKKIFF